MRQLFLLLPLFVVACASPTPPPPSPKPVDPTVVSDFRIVPRAPDVASYPIEPELVWVPVQGDRVFVTVKVVNYTLPRIAPPPITPPAARPAGAVSRAPQPVVFRTSVRFAFDRSVLDSHSRAELDKFVASVGRDIASSDVVVDGYTDSVGTSDYNQRLSQRRAQTVRDYLVTKGAPTARVSASGHGEADPESTNATAQGRSVNRRASVVVTPE